jgi:multidrug efflux system outer membrane protein
MACWALVALAGCTVGPDFRRPHVEVPTAWKGVGTSAPALPVTAEERELARWWTLFQDRTLNLLVERAVESNLDLKLAEARIREARAAKGTASSSLGPTASGGGSFRRSRSSASTPGGDAVMGFQGGKAKEVVTDQYEIGFDAGWEMDVLGGVRRGLEAAQADLEATVEGRRDVLVTLTAEVAGNYVELRALQQRTAIAQESLKAQQRTADLTRQRFEAGLASFLDVANARALVATTAGQIPLLEASARQRIHAIGLLLGRDPAALAEELSTATEIPEPPSVVALGVPSDLLRRRPDIRRAEMELHAATARIGVATAELFPKFTISGSIGLQASDLASWFNWVKRLWSFGPSVKWRLFEMGRIRSEIARMEALQEQSLIAYKHTVLRALKEVEDALVAAAKEEEHREALAEAVMANRKAVEIATKLYTEGQTDFLNVLQAQRSLYASQDELVQSLRTSSISVIALYKALGGGWEGETEEPLPAPVSSAQDLEDLRFAPRRDPWN